MTYLKYFLIIFTLFFTSTKIQSSEEQLSCNNEQKLFGQFTISEVAKELQKIYSVKRNPDHEEAFYIHPEFLTESLDVKNVERIFNLAYNETERKGIIEESYSEINKIPYLRKLELVKGYLFNIEKRIFKPELSHIYKNAKTKPFELTKFPGFIFKTGIKWPDFLYQYKNEDGSLKFSPSGKYLPPQNRILEDIIFPKPKFRFENHLRVKQILNEDDELNIFGLPETEFFEMNLGEGIILEVVIEKKVKLAEINDRSYLNLSPPYNPLFTTKFKTDEKIKEHLRNIAKQITKLICLTECWDVKMSNFPLDQNLEKVWVLDTEDLFHSILESSGHYLSEGRSCHKENEGITPNCMNAIFWGLYELLERSHPDFRDDILEVASETLGIEIGTLLGRIYG